MRIRPVMRALCLVLIASVLWQVPTAGAVRAAMVATDAVIQARQDARARSGDAAREGLRSMLRRDEMRAALRARGVDPGEAEARIDGLSDTEVAALVGRIERAPAGAGPCDEFETTAGCVGYRTGQAALVVVIVYVVLVTIGFVYLVAVWG